MTEGAARILTAIDNIMLAYGCGVEPAFDIQSQTTAFARAVRYFGPLLCHHDSGSRWWTLYGRRTSIEGIVAAAAIRRHETSARVSKILKLPPEAV